jgi:hypothetical protein
MNFSDFLTWIDLAHDAQSICDSNLSWETKYDLIFSASISQKMHSILRLDYYDPDTTYEEDVRAFCRAAAEKAAELRELLEGESL